MADGYRKIVIGSIVQLPVAVRQPTGAIVDLSGADVTVRVFGPDAGGALVVTDGVCATNVTGATYEWDTTGLTAGRYSVQFLFDFGALLSIEPADPITVLLVSRLGGA